MNPARIGCSSLTGDTGHPRYPGSVYVNAAVDAAPGGTTRPEASGANAHAHAIASKTTLPRDTLRSDASVTKRLGRFAFLEEPPGCPSPRARAYASASRISPATRSHHLSCTDPGG